MANRTDTQADTVHGGNPQYLVDRIVRVKIYNDAYWKEHCFALTNETLIDKAAELDYVSGTYGGRRRPAKFLCLLLKMLQIQPDEDVVMEYIKQSDLKYLRALAVTYLRLTGRAKTIYETLEPLYADYRKLRYRNIQGKLSLIHMDELIDWCFTEEQIVDVTMPALPAREVLVGCENLGPRQSVLEDDLDDLEELEAAMNPKRSPEREASPAPAPAAPEAPAPAAADDAPRRSATPSRGNGGGARQDPSGSPKQRRSRDRSGSRRQRSRSTRRQETRRRSRSRHNSEASRGSEGSRRGRRKEKDRKDREKERPNERERERPKEKESQKEDKNERREKKEKKEKREADEREPKGKKDKKEKKEERAESPAPEKKEKERKEPKEKKKGLFKGDERASAKEKKEGKSGPKNDKDGLSVDGWNDVRKSLGLKPLSA